MTSTLLPPEDQRKPSPPSKIWPPVPLTAWLISVGRGAIKERTVLPGQSYLVGRTARPWLRFPDIASMLHRQQRNSQCLSELQTYALPLNRNDLVYNRFRPEPNLLPLSLPPSASSWSYDGHWSTNLSASGLAFWVVKFQPNRNTRTRTAFGCFRANGFNLNKGFKWHCCETAPILCKARCPTHIRLPC